MAGKKRGSENFSFGPSLWKSADKMRGKMDASLYRVLIIPLIWVKYISDSFDHYKNMSGISADDSKDLKGGGRYGVPNEAHWNDITSWTASEDDTSDSDDENLGNFIATALTKLAEKKAPAVQQAYKFFARGYVNLDPVSNRVLAGVVELFNRPTGEGGLPDFYAEGSGRSEDLLGYVYEFFIGKFAEKEKRGGEFYTPRTIVKLIVKMIEPFDGDIYDGCCGSGGMFFQSPKLVESLRKSVDFKIYGQEANSFTWACGVLNLEYRIGGEFDLGPHNEDTLLKPLHRGMKFRYAITNPPFNLKHWTEEVVPPIGQDERWMLIDDKRYVNDSNANFAWIQHYLDHLDSKGIAAIVMTNGSLSSAKAEDKIVREAIVEGDFLDCVVLLPDKMFTNAGISACIWILTKDKTRRQHRNRSGETLFIDCRKVPGEMVSRTKREFTEDELDRIGGTYNNWRSKKNFESYEDERGFCKSATTVDIKEHDYILVPGRYVGAPPYVDDGVPFQEKMDGQLERKRKLSKESKRLDKEIRKNLRELGFEY